MGGVDGDVGLVLVVLLWLLLVLGLGWGVGVMSVGMGWWRSVHWWESVEHDSSLWLVVREREKRMIQLSCFFSSCSLVELSFTERVLT